jgi:hypothetical protein
MGEMIRKVTEPELDLNKLAYLGKARTDWQAKNPVVSGSRWDNLFNEHFNHWYSGNFNPNTGKIKLYRFLNLDSIDIETITTNGLFPGAYRAGKKIRSFREVLQFLEEAGKKREINDLVSWLEGDRKGISCNAMTSGSGDPYDIRQCFTTDPNMWGNQYRVTVELDPNDAIREFSFQPPELEWDVLGPVDASKIVEITEQSNRALKTGPIVVYKRD